MTVESNIQGTLTEGFEIYRKQFVALIIGMMIAAIGSILVITAPPLFFGMYMMARKVTRGQKTEAVDVLKGFDYFVTSWIMTLAAGVAIIIGLMCLVVPGLLLLVLLQYSVAIAVSEKIGAIDALKKSYNMGKQNITYSIILLLFLSVINTIGGALQIGWILTFPYTILCTTIAAQKLAVKK
jgi:uncharacterized membrane protein